QKWLFSRSLVLYTQRRSRDSDGANAEHVRNVAVMLNNQLDLLPDFGSNAFGLEQRLRDKMKLLVIAATKCFIFRTWAMYSGVTSTARLHFRKKSLRQGLDMMLEYCVKQRMYRRTSLHALAARRQHVNELNMAPVL